MALTGADARRAYEQTKLELETLRAESERLSSQTASLMNIQKQVSSAFIKQRSGILGFTATILQTNQQLTQTAVVERNRQRLLRDQIRTIETQLRALDTNTAEYKKLNNTKSRLNDELNKSTQFAKSIKWQRLGENMNMLADSMKKMAEAVNQTQQQFGIDIETATVLKTKDMMRSAQSYIDSITSGFTKRAVSEKDIVDARTAFQNQFGGLLSTAAAAKIAEEAKRMGVSAEQFAQARRAFMTQTMGSAKEADRIQKRFIGEFEKKGLTAKDAMLFVGQNSELLARNGVRFATQMARAAADAKKIGVDLGKISQIGDNIINDFEGFLESQAELGAMGFNFDSSRLAEIAETGSDADLYNELRSQLSASGKDITKLRRSERLQLEKAYGINISEMQRMAGVTPGGVGGEEAVSPEELQKEANGLLSRIAVAVETFGPIMEGLATAFGIFSNLYFARKLAQLGTPAGRSGGTFIGGRGFRVRARGRVLGRRAARMARRVGGTLRRGASRVSGLIPTRIFNFFGNILESVTFHLSRFGGLLSGLGTRILSSTGLFGRGLSALGTFFGRIGSRVPGLSRFGNVVKGTGVLSLAAAALDARSEYKARKEEGYNTATAATMGGVKAGGIFGGFLLGAKAGGAVGAAAGTLAAPVAGTAVGAVVGSILGGIAGAFAGEKAANWMNEYITKPLSSGLSKIGPSVSKMWDSFTEFFSRKPETRPPTPTPRRYAKGGLVTGPGTGTSDSISAKLSAGEYVIPAATTKKLGTGFLNGLVSDMVEYGPLASSPFEKGELTKKGSLLHLRKLVTGKLGLDKFDFIPKEVKTPFGTIEKFGGKTLKFLASNAKTLPILGSILGGGLEAYDEYKNSGSLLRGVGKGIFSAGGGILGSVAALLMGTGNPILAALGGVAGSAGGEKLFELMFNDKKAKKYHNGGIVGENNELPAILQRGEAVLSKLQLGSLDRLIGGFNKIGSFGERLDSSISTLTSQSGGLSKLSNTGNLLNTKVGGYMEKISGTTGKFGGTEELKEKTLGAVKSRIPGVSSLFGGKAGEAIGKAQELKAGGKEGLLSMAQNKFGSLFGGKAGNAFSEITKLSTGGGTAAGNLMGLANKIPGVGGLLGKATGLLGKGGLKTFSTNLLGKVGLGNIAGSLAGGPITTLTSIAAPLLKKIPVVGPMLGKIADAPNKLIGSAVGKVGGFVKGLFNKGKDGKSVASKVAGFAEKGPIGSLASKVLGKKVGSAIGMATSPLGKVAALGKLGGKLFGKKKKEEVPPMTAAPELASAGNLSTLMPDVMSQIKTSGQSTILQAPPVDTRGIEQKLDSFVTALRNIQINMDGAQVGKVLVNSSEAATTVGVFRQSSRATL